MLTGCFSGCDRDTKRCRLRIRLLLCTFVCQLLGRYPGGKQKTIQGGVWSENDAAHVFYAKAQHVELIVSDRHDSPGRAF